MLKKFQLELNAVFEPYINFDMTSSVAPYKSTYNYKRINLKVKEVVYNLTKMFDNFSCVNVSIIPIKIFKDLDSNKNYIIIDSSLSSDYGLDLTEEHDNLYEVVLTLDGYSTLSISDDYGSIKKVELENIFNENPSELEKICYSLVLLQMQYSHAVLTDGREYFANFDDSHFMLRKF